MPVAFGSRQGEMSYARWRKGIRRTRGARNGNYKHGRYTAETIASRRWPRRRIREVRPLTRRLRQLKDGRAYS